MTSIDGGAGPIGPDRAARVGPRVGLAVGALAGLASGSLGIGGGLIVVPLLSAWLGVPLKRAVGTSLLAVMVTALVAVLCEIVVAPVNLHWGVAAIISAGAIAGAFAGARLVAILPVRQLAILLAVVLVVAAVRMSGLLDGLGPARALAPASSPAIAVAHGAMGLGAGLLASLFGIGGGILVVPALAVVHPDWAFQACRATSLVMIVPTSLVGALLHHRLANVDVALAKGLLPGCSMGAVLGVLLANHVPGRPLEIAFAALLLVSAAQLVRRSRVSDPAAK